VVSKAKLYDRLDDLEAQLRGALVPHLRTAAQGNNDLIFCVKQFNSFRELKYKKDELTEELIDIGALIISLREKLGEPTEGTIAERICFYCREWGNSGSQHRPNSNVLARNLYKFM